MPTRRRRSVHGVAGWISLAAGAWGTVILLNYFQAAAADLHDVDALSLPLAHSVTDISNTTARAGRTVGGVVLLILAAFITGAALIRWILAATRRGDAILFIAAGLGTLGTALTGLGFTGLLRRDFLFGLTVAAAPLGLPVILRIRRARPKYGRAPLPTPISHAMLTVAIVSWLVQSIAALAPTTEIDSLSYHLGKSALFLRTGRIVAPADNVSFHLPSLWELNLSLIEVVGGEAAPGVLPSLVTLLTALLLWTALRPHGATPAALAVLLFVAAPPVVRITASAKNDLFVGLFGLAAFLAARRGGIRWTLVAGTLCGFGLATKPTAVLTLLPVIGAVWIGTQRPGMRPARLGWLALSMTIWCAPWSVRSWIDNGHPLYPLVGSRPGGPGLAARDLIRRELHGYTRAKYDTVMDTLRAPWSLAATEATTMLPALALPAVLLALAAPGPARPWAAAGLVMLVGWACGPPRVHYLAQALPMWCAATALLPARLPVALLGAVASIDLIRSAVDPELDFPGRLRAASGLESRSSYLERRLPGYARAIHRATARLPLNARVVFHGELRSVPLQRQGTPPSVAEPFAFLHLAAASRDLPHLEHKIRQTGATHLIINRTNAVYRRFDHEPLLPAPRALALWSVYWQRHADLQFESPVFTAREGAHYLYALGKTRRSGLLLPGIEAWLAEPERLAATSRWREAAKSIDLIRRITGDVALLDHAEATILAPILTPSHRRMLLERAERHGLRAVSLYLALAELADRSGRRTDARRYRRMATDLDPLSAPR